jgi:hypothetical protein
VTPAAVTAAAPALQAALVAVLRADPIIAAAVSGVFDGPPARPAFPYIVVDGGQVLDWSVKDARGREHRIGVSMWDDGMAANRLHGLMAQAEEAIEDMPRTLDGGHRIASLLFVRGRILRQGRGPWAGLLEYRVRTLAAA